MNDEKSDYNQGKLMLARAYYEHRLRPVVKAWKEHSSIRTFWETADFDFEKKVEQLRGMWEKRRSNPPDPDSLEERTYQLLGKLEKYLDFNALGKAASRRELAAVLEDSLKEIHALMRQNEELKAMAKKAATLNEILASVKGQTTSFQGVERNLTSVYDLVKPKVNIKAKITQKETATIWGVSKRTIINWDAGKNRPEEYPGRNVTIVEMMERARLWQHQKRMTKAAYEMHNRRTRYKEDRDLPEDEY